MKITDYHRDIAARYYAGLVRRFGLARTLRRIPFLKTRIWTKRGFDILEKHV